MSSSYLITVDTLVRPLSRVHTHVFVETGRLGEALPAHRALQIRQMPDISTSESRLKFIHI